MRNAKVILSLVLCTAVIFCGMISAFAYQYTSYSFSPDGSKVFCDDSGAYIASANSNQLYIEKTAPQSFSRTLTLPYTISDYQISLNQATAVCIDELNHQTVIFFYDIDSDILDSFSIASYINRTNMGYAANSSGVYLCDSNSPNIVNRYSYTGKREYFYEFPTSVSCITQDYSGNIYVVSGNCLYRLDSASLVSFSGDTVDQNVRFLSGDMLIDLSGWILSISSGTALRLFRVEDAGCFGAVIGDRCYLAAGNTVYRYDLSGNRTGFCELNASVISLCSVSDSIPAFTAENGIRMNDLSDSDFTAILTAGDNNGSLNDRAENTAGGITSDVYRIDYEHMMIYDISPKTTTSAFKSNINYGGYGLTLYQDTAIRKSGNLATAMTAEFYSQDFLRFELCINGDITGEGNVNTKDRNALMDYLLGSWSLSGAYLYSADLNFDGTIDLLDLVLLCQMNET
ncbi:MAG: dockerin type I repeat-containing protein [Ruminococcus sp.]|nr:dockerin type I repeat-containing protein [Ruminococcus sp.]